MASAVASATGIDGTSADSRRVVISRIVTQIDGAKRP